MRVQGLKRRRTKKTPYVPLPRDERLKELEKIVLKIRKKLFPSAFEER
mgnify:CR=1 FL=1